MLPAEPPKNLPATLYINRLRAFAPDQEKAINDNDPNGGHGLTDSEWQTRSPEQQRQIWDNLRDALEIGGVDLGYLISESGNKDIHAGKPVAATAPGHLGENDDRFHSLSSAIRSEANIVEPLFSNAIVGPGPDNFDTRVDALIDNAEEYIFLRAFELERRDRVERLIAKAKDGVHVEIVIQPVAKSIRPKQQREMYELLKKASEQYPNLHIMESDIVPSTTKNGFEQIMHGKGVTADSGGVPTSVVGGINHGENSSNNFDMAVIIKGVAALDAIKQFLHYVPKAERDRAIKSIEEFVPTKDVIEKAVRALAKENDIELTTIDYGVSGERLVDPPHKYKPNELEARLKSDPPKRVRLDAMELFPEGLEGPKNEFVWDLINESSESLSHLTVMYPAGLSKEDKNKWKRKLGGLRKRGADTVAADDKVREESLRNLTYQQMNLAIERGESLDMAEFAETDRNELLMAGELFRSGGDVRAIVHDLEIDDSAINRKFWYILSQSNREVEGKPGETEHVPIKVFTKESGEALAPDTAEDPSLVKLHSKVKIFGLKRNDGEETEPRLFVRTANGSRMGHQVNVEAGVVIHSAAIAQKAKDMLFDPLYESEHVPAIDPVKFVPDAERVDLLPRVSVDTPDEKIYVLMHDYESTGVQGSHLGAVPVSGYYRLFEYNPANDQYKPVPGTGRNIVFRQPKGELGKFLTIPKNSSDIHGLTPEKIERIARVNEVYNEWEGKLNDNERARYAEKYGPADPAVDPEGRIPLRRAFVDLYGYGEDFVGWLDTEVYDFEDALDTVTRYVKGLGAEFGNVVWAGQNDGKFDLPLLDGLLAMEHLAVDGENPQINGPYIDTLNLAKEVLKDERAFNLDHLSLRLGVREEGRDIHTAEEDVGITMAVFQQLRMIKRMHLYLESKDVNPYWAGRMTAAMGGIEALGKAPEEAYEQAIEDFYVEELSVREKGPFRLQELGVSEVTIREFLKTNFDEESMREFVRTYTKGLAPTVKSTVDTFLEDPSVQKVNLGQLTPIDKLDFSPGDKIKIYARPKSRNAIGNLEYIKDLRVDGDIGNPDMITETGDPSDASSVDFRKVTEHRVTGVEGNRLRVEFATGTGGAQNWYTRYIDIKDARFAVGGKILFGLMDDGHDMAPPTILRPREPYVGERGAKKDA